MRSKRFTSRSLARRFTLNYLLVSTIPVLFMFVLAVVGTRATRSYLADLISKSTHALNQDAERSLQKLGEQFIQNKAKDVAKQVEVYFRMHPDQTIQEMRNDPIFMDIAIQKVGRTGYTAISESQTYMLRVHPNPHLVDFDMRKLAKQIPSWWAIVQQAIDGDPASGYYDWIEPDGSVRKKYMAVTPVGIPLHGVTMMVSATTYIDEFSLPIVDMKNKATGIVARYRGSMNHLWFIFGLIAVLVIVLSFCGTFILGRRLTVQFIRPIVQLADSARQYGKGNWNTQIPDDLRQRRDEIGILALALNTMSRQLKDLFSRLENRLAELKKTQQALAESESHYRSLFDGVPVGLYRSAPDGRIMDANRTLVTMLGFPNRKHFLATKAEDLYVDERDRAMWKEQMESLDEVHYFNTRMKKLNGAIISIENHSRVVRDDNGNILYYEGSLKDITEKKQAEAALRKSRTRLKKLYEESKRGQEVYRSLIRSSADAIVIYDLQLKATYTSPMFTKIFGWTADELIDPRTPFVPEVEYRNTRSAIDSVIDTGIPCQGLETKRATKDGRVIDVSISASRYDDHAGQPAGVLMLLRDISEKNRLKAQLEHIERMEAIGTLAGGVAHDFNNLLMAIQGSITLMRYGLDPADPNYKNFLNIEKQVERGSRLTSQLLGYARKGKYEVHALNLVEIIKESAETLQRTRKDISIHFELSQDLSPVEADINQIEQVLLNLFINASDAMGDGGDLFLAARNVDARDIVGKAYAPKPGQYVLMTVKDTGIGMEAKTMSRIFDPFFTTKAMGRGTGLGLASVYGIVKGHGGYIDVDSKPGKGTTFSIYLPASRKPVEKSSSTPTMPAKGSGTILLVDDEALVLEVGANMLSALGYTVISAESGRQAIEIIEQQDNQIDLVILDMIMPDISGGTTFDKIHDIDPRMAVLLSSGYSIDGKATEILNRGCNGFIQKPYSIERLSEKIQEILGN